MCARRYILEATNVAAMAALLKLSTRASSQIFKQYPNNFGFLNRTAPETVNARDKLFVQEGRKVFREVVPMVAELIEQHLNDNSLAAGDLRRMWLHQANRGMNDLIAKKVLGREPTTPNNPPCLTNMPIQVQPDPLLPFINTKKISMPAILA